MNRNLRLASSSSYRRQLLARLGLPFETANPGVDESPIDGEAPADRARRLARAKANSLAHGQANELIIGSDQVAELDGQVLDKPGTVDRAHEQLTACSGHAVRFHTALCLRDAGSDRHALHCDLTVVHFRNLSSAEIHRYIELERPLDCAGSFKCEGLGIALFDRIETHDPTALVGLPLIAVAGMLRRFGCDVP